MVLALLVHFYTLDCKGISTAFTPKDNWYQDDEFVRTEASEAQKERSFYSSPYFVAKSEKPAGVPGLPLASAAGYPASPPHPYHAQAPSRTMRLWYGGWDSGGIRIHDDDETSHLYSVKFQTKKPHLSLESASTGATIGTATYHPSTSRIDTVLHQSPFTLTSHEFLKNGCSYASPALAGASMTWKTQGHNLDLVCSDDWNVTLARFHFDAWGLKQCGKLEFFTDFVATDSTLGEEILVTGLALMEGMLCLRYTYTPL